MTLDAGGGDRAETIDYLRLVSERAGIPIDEFVAPEDVQFVAGNIRLHYLDWGTAGRPLLVFLHGSALTAHSWDIVCLALRDRFHCVALDQRGHGDSEWSPELDYGAAASTRDLRALLRRLGDERGVFVGMSLGGLNAMHLAVAAPEVVRALAVVDVGPNVKPGRGREIAQFMDATASVDSIEEYVEQAVRFNPRRDPRLLRRSLSYNLRPRPEGGFAWKWDPRPRGSETFAQDIRRELGELWEQVSAIAAPTLLIRGTESPIFLAEDVEELAGQMPNARVVEVENAGHAVQGDNPAGLLRELEAFLGELGS
jgi:pimeloyl-ACP methyl ester carboxylesterase